MASVGPATAVRGTNSAHSTHCHGVVKVRCAVVKLLADVFWLGKTHDGVYDLFPVGLRNVLAATFEDPLDLFLGADGFHFTLNGGFGELIPKAVDKHVHTVATSFTLDALVISKAPCPIFENNHQANLQQ